MKRRTFLQSTFAAAAVAAVPGRRTLAGLYRPAPARPPDVPAVTGDGEAITLARDDIADLAARMRGPVLLRDDDGYGEARLVLNPSFDKYPALIARPTGVADVQAAVDFARAYGVLLAVKCGGHSASGKSTCDDGMMIDLSRFRATRVDPHARKVWVAGGSLLGAVDHESMAHGLVTPMGTVSHTGVGGLVLGGGFGRVARRFGLSIDNLLGVDIVTADGELRHANPHENPDLYWAVRGGGGNFGIVTNFEFRLHPMQRQVIGGPIFFPLDRARDALALYGEYGPEAPDELALDYVMVSPPGGEDGMAGFGVCFSGPHDEAERALAPVRKLGTPIVDGVGPIDYVALQRSGDIDDPRALGAYLKGGFVGELPSALVAAIVEGFEAHPGRGTALFFQQSGGAIGRVPEDATAFPHRHAFGNMMTNVDWPHGIDPSPHIDWIRSYWSTLVGLTGGLYTNDMAPDLTTADVNANFRGNYERLVEVKNRFDSANLFRLNANVQPTART
ncbi:MAG: FAD-binding oxidoreductase [Gemmatimonadota bacterium]|nr:FAD-binding oxidoreductase [Gemmatimonadota bacterium]